MAAIASINASQNGIFAALRSTLSADDTITIAANKKQLLVIHNPTGGTLTATLDGDGASAAFPVPGVGTIDLTAGLAIAVGAGLSRAVMLNTVSGYCLGVVHLLGGAGLVVQLFDI